MKWSFDSAFRDPERLEEEPRDAPIGEITELDVPETELNEPGILENFKKQQRTAKYSSNVI